MCMNVTIDCTYDKGSSYKDDQFDEQIFHVHMCYSFLIFLLRVNLVGYYITIRAPIAVFSLAFLLMRNRLNNSRYVLSQRLGVLRRCFAR